MATLLLLSFLFTVSSASISVLSYDVVTKDQAVCLQSLGYTGFSAPIWRENCLYDPKGLANIATANAAGGFSRIDALFIPSSNCTSFENQMEAAINKMRSMDLKIGTIWIDCSFSRVWTAGNVTSNRAALSSLVRRASSMGQELGFKTDKNSFESVFGSDFALYSHYPLWWNNVNNHADFSGFEAFGGWNSAVLHRYGYGDPDTCGQYDTELSYFV